MLKTIKISIDKPLVNDTSDLTHVSTSYQVSKVPDFSDPSNLIVDIVEDTTNLLTYSFQYDIATDQALYLRTKYHFNLDRSVNWSKIIPLLGNQVGIKLSTTIINTPVVTLNMNYTTDIKVLNINTSDYKLFGGIGNHISTSYEIVDTDGRVHYKRLEDKDNLTSIEVPMEELTIGKSYIVKVRYHSDTNANSNYGKALLVTNTVGDNLFDMYMPYYFVPKRHVWFNLSIYTPNYDSVDLIITDKYDNIVAENLKQNSTTPNIYTGDIIIGDHYSIKARVNYTDGTSGNYKTIYGNVVVKNTLMQFNTDTSYLGLYDFTQYMNLNGANVQTSFESYSNGILLGKGDDNNVYRYSLVGGELQEQEVAFTLNNVTPMKKQFMNFLPLHNSKLLVDYSSGLVDGEYRKPIFQVYDYNVITQEFTFQHELLRDNERYSTALSSSAAATVGDKVYYIPSRVVDADNVDQPLTLNYYDSNNNVVNVAATLPVTIKRFGSLISLGDGKLLFLGGALDPELDGHNVIYKRSNHDVYTYDIPTDTWAKVTTLPSFISVDIYNLQAFLRKDEKIILFNGVEDGIAVGNQDTYIYNRVLNSITQETNDTGDSLRYNSTIVMQNGDIGRVSSRTLDPQKMFTYISNTKLASDVSDNVTIDVIEDLVVPAGEIITIESPYRYKSVIVEGTSLDDTGLLRWIDGDIVHEFRYRDYLVCQPTDIVNNLFDPVEGWDTVTILDGASLNVSNVIWVPDGVTFTIPTDFTVDEILLGVNSELEVTV